MAEARRCAATQSWTRVTGRPCQFGAHLAPAILPGVPAGGGLFRRGSATAGLPNARNPPLAGEVVNEASSGDESLNLLPPVKAPLGFPCLFLWQGCLNVRWFTEVHVAVQSHFEHRCAAEDHRRPGDSGIRQGSRSSAGCSPTTRCAHSWAVRKEELIGKSDFDFVPPEQAEVFWRKDDLVFSTGEENENEEKISDRSGSCGRSSPASA